VYSLFFFRFIFLHDRRLVVLDMHKLDGRKQDDITKKSGDFGPRRIPQADFGRPTLLQLEPNMSNQPKKKTHFLSAIRSGYRSLRSRPPSPTTAAQTVPIASESPPGAPSLLISSPPSLTGQNPHIQSVTPPISAAQAGSSKPGDSSSYPGRSLLQRSASAL